MKIGKGLSQVGFSFLEIMIAMSISGIMMSALFMMQDQQNREMRAARELAAANELQRVATQAVAANPVCNFILADTGKTAAGLKQGGTAIANGASATFSLPTSYPINSAFTIDNIPRSAIAGYSDVAAAVNAAVTGARSLSVASITIDITDGPIAGAVPPACVLPATVQGNVCVCPGNMVLNGGGTTCGCTSPMVVSGTGNSCVSGGSTPPCTAPLIATKDGLNCKPEDMCPDCVNVNIGMGWQCRRAAYPNTNTVTCTGPSGDTGLPIPTGTQACASVSGFGPSQICGDQL